MHRDGYAGGRLLETLHDGRKRIQLDQMDAPMVVDADVVHRANDRRLDRCDDGQRLTFVNETSMLHLLRQRYGCNLIHTNVGPHVTAVVNPLQTFSAFYTPKVMRMFKVSV